MTLLSCLYGFKMSLPESLISCAALSTATAIFAYLLWRHNGPLERVTGKTMLKMSLGGAAGIGLLLMIDAFIAHVNLLDRSQWPNLWRSGGFLGFGTTAVIGVLAPIVWFATLVRYVVHQLFSGNRSEPRC